MARDVAMKSEVQSCCAPARTVNATTNVQSLNMHIARCVLKLAAGVNSRASKHKGYYVIFKGLQKKHNRLHSLLVSLCCIFAESNRRFSCGSMYGDIL